MAIGEAIRKRRDELKLTQQEVGARMGEHPLYISRWERGSAPSLDNIKKLAAALETTVDELLGN